ncbi:FimV/HubP family polar landmark protein [Variovorax sp. WS11]|uniref:FimV/HubP family polar landmark protein n=2 Tax=Variovorax sp. WS11 TaxID=1105204 RepID=UPI00280A8F8D|nr:FimV/HubP family polar landmark protein [Variovorax sp. WS11]
MSFDAAALALGRLNVQSALGEPLRAEIEVTEIAPAEADGLKVNIARVDAFNAAGVPYNAVLADVRTSLQRRADGRYVVRLTSNRSLSEPFIDLLVEANWNSGRVVRDYTVLLDPPRSRTATAAAPIAPTAPQISAAPEPRSAPAVTQAPPRRAPAPAVASAPAAPAASERSVRTGSGSGSGEQQVTVQPGDTASKIAGAYKSADVSLDQMLVALLRANPSAFIAGNVNRIKAGAVLDVPNASQAAAVPSEEAKRTVTAQSRDFGDYRRRLAENAPASQVADADRQAKGKLQANVEDRNAANAAADKLRVTQGGAGGQTEEQLARSRQAQESNTRVAELSKNIDELNKLQAASGSPPATGAGSTAQAATPAPAGAAPTAPGSTAAPAAAAPAANPAAPALPAAIAPAATATAAAPAAPAAAPTSAPEAAAAAPAAAPAPAPAAAAKAPAPVPAPAPGFFDELLANPLILGGAALIALLVGFLLYRVLGRKRRDAGESVFLESRIPKDSFFGASGGESVDTKNRGNSVVSSLSYSPSQLDAGDVDPVAEADVYLAYGRDLQAEEILREALRVNPERTAIHLKLLEIHAKRRDLRAYEALASDVHKLTGGTGADWSRVVEMGKDLDPGNPLYESGGRNVTPAEAAAFAGTLAAATAVTTAPAVAAPTPAPVVAAPPPAFVPSVAPLDFDLDLSKPAPLAPANVGASLPPTQIQVPAPAQPVPRVSVTNGSHSGPTAPSAKLDLHNDFDTAPGALEPTTVRAPLVSDEEMTQPATLRAGLPGDSGFIEFDMSSMAGLRAPADTERGRLEPLAEDSGESPHAIKLSLARELKALGDVEGARSLVEEVAAEASDEVKAEAKQLLVQLR